MPNLIAAPHDRDSQGIAGRLEPGEWMADDGLMWRTPVGFRPEVYTCFHTFEDALSWLNTQTGAKESFVGLASLRWIPLNYAQIGMHTVKKEVEVNEPKMGWKLKEDL